jgi:hypothetical protein
MRSILTIVAVLALFCACATPPLIQPAGGASKGGEAQSDQVSVDPAIALAQPGGTAVSMPLSVDDKISSTQAGDSPQLSLVAGVGVASALLAAGPEEKNLIDLIALDMKHRAEDGVNVEVIDDRLRQWREELASIKERKIELLAAVTPDLSALKQIVFVVVQIKSAGEDEQKLDAEAIEKAAANLGLITPIATKALE